MRKITKKVILTLFCCVFAGPFLFAQTFTTNGDAISLGNNCWQLTPNLTNKKGTIWNTQTINLNNPFDFTFHYTATPNGADGAAFVLQTTGTSVQGGAGSGLGFGSPIPISPSLAVELDLWDNSGAGLADIAQDHIAVHGNGVMTSALAGPVAALSSGANIADGVCRKFRIVWTPVTNNLDIYFNGALRLSYVNNIRSTIFGGNTLVFWGFTAATGGTGCQQTICYEFANAGPDGGVCIGSTYQLNASGGTSYTWSPNFFLSNASISNPVFTPPNIVAVAGYSVNVTNSLGCQDKDSIYISVEAVPVANAGSNQTICSGNSVQIGTPAVSGRSYSWSPATGLNNANIAQPTASPSSSTTYTLTVTNTTGVANCTATSTVTVTVNQTPVAQAGNDATVCAGSCANLGVPPVPTYTYSWSPTTGLSNPTSSFPTACPTSTTTYTLTTTNGTCSGTDNVTVTVNQLPAADAGPDAAVCEGACTTIGTAAVTGYTYSWSPATSLSATNIAQPTACPTGNSQYVVTVSQTSTGCSQKDTMDLTVNANPLAEAGPDTAACAGGCVNLGATATAGVTYSWSPTSGLSSPTSSNPSACPGAPTAYILTATTTANGCTAKDTVQVAIKPLPNAQAGPDTGYCAGSSVQIGVAAQSGFLYSWNPPLGLSSDTVANPVANPPGNLGYILAVTEISTGCTGYDSVTVSLYTTPLADFTFSSTNKTATFSNASAGAAAYSWDFGDGNTDTTTSPVHTYGADGTYQVCLVAWSAERCTDTVCKTVTIVSIGFAEEDFREFHLYPNPSQGHLALSWKGIEPGPGRMLATDLSGKVIWAKSYDFAPDGKLELDFDWAQGTYFVLLETGGGRLVRKLIVR
ncbi:MAG: T9SS type A sorting domain-containing protein [Bacteroidia bacterium]|nr:T9SS type A sorting domain-containing protein [Bacteroidia bacterium]